MTEAQEEQAALEGYVCFYMWTGTRYHRPIAVRSSGRPSGWAIKSACGLCRTGGDFTLMDRAPERMTPCRRCWPDRAKLTLDNEGRPVVE